MTMIGCKPIAPPPDWEQGPVTSQELMDLRRMAYDIPIAGKREKAIKLFGLIMDAFRGKLDPDREGVKHLAYEIRMLAGNWMTREQMMEVSVTEKAPTAEREVQSLLSKMKPAQILELLAKAGKEVMPPPTSSPTQA